MSEVALQFNMSRRGRRRLGRPGQLALMSRTTSAPGGSSVQGSGSNAAVLEVAAVELAPAPPKPTNDVLAGAAARMASQSTIHPLDTVKVRMQAPTKGPSASASAGKYGLGSGTAIASGAAQIGSLYRGVAGAAGGAGIAIGTYFAFYGATKRTLTEHTQLSLGAVAFLAGAAGALGSSIVKVPAAVCIRSVQANLYPNVVAASKGITKAAGVRGLFTGYLPTVLEDVPDMAVKFAAYEMARQLYGAAMQRSPNAAEDMALGGGAGALAAAATTPLDVCKTRMMVAAASRPSIASAARAVLSDAGPRGFFAGVGPRALSNGVNSAVFFAFFETIRRWQEAHALRSAAAARKKPAKPAGEPALVSTIASAAPVHEASITLTHLAAKKNKN
mmetsp:Transcript_4418/g.15356  ORF Transcript_4418/g.15356 Transcript_4418/m.15356 type:complete len:389 (-) Transcript_4418:48-1214(-)